MESDFIFFFFFFWGYMGWPFKGDRVYFWDFDVRAGSYSYWAVKSQASQVPFHFK